MNWIEQEGLASTVYVAAALSGLWVSDRPHQSRGDHILTVTPDGSEFVYFEYHRTGDASGGMRKNVHYADALECFREFLAYTFGAYRNQR